MFVGCGVVGARPRAVTFGPFSDLVFGPVPFSFVLVQSIVLFPESTRGFAPFPESIWALPLLFFMMMLLISLATTQLASLDVLHLSYLDAG